MNHAQKALLDRLRELIEETPKSGALNAGKRPLYVTRFSQAVERRAKNGPALVEYTRAKIYETATTSYSALVEAGRVDLTVEAVVADDTAPWASEFTEADRAAARARLGTMLEAHQETQQAAEDAAVAYDRKIVGQVSAIREAKGKPPLTREQQEQMLKDRARRRAVGS